MMGRLSIDEIIEHCHKKVARFENVVSRECIENEELFDKCFGKEYWEHKQVAEYLEELKKYRQLKEQGLLLRLPCKVGDTAYFIHEAYSFDDEEKHLEVGSGKFSLSWLDYPRQIFASREEAEQALAEMKGGGHNRSIRPPHCMMCGQKLKWN